MNPAKPSQAKASRILPPQKLLNRAIFIISSLFLLARARLAAAVDIVEDAKGIASPNNLVMGDFKTVIINLITWLLSFIGLLALAAIIWGGIMYILALGDEKRTTKAKAIIFYAIVGVFIAGISFLIITTIKSLLGV